MLEIRKSTCSRSYENSFFRDFSKHLHRSFKDKNLSGVLIGCPICIVDERLQIDALLITSSVVCIIDFKNFGGKIYLPDEDNFKNGLWKNESGQQIKGGSSINPYRQLENQKRRFIDVFNKHIQKEIKPPNLFNPSHLVRVVCFQGEVELFGQIPSNESLNFFILNKANFIEKICDIVDVADKNVQLNEESFNSFKEIFRADKFQFDENPYQDRLKDIASKSTKLDYSTLHEDQRIALTEIKSFLEDSEKRIFILQGTTNSGKSYLIPFVQELAYDINIQESEIFAATGKVANNLFSMNNLEKVNSIYSYIYGGTSIEEEEDEELTEEVENESEKQKISEKIPLEIVPLKKCDNTEDALFIVDESQLVSDTRYETIDLRFGSGFLLRDFLEFANLQSSKRKIIFIGDPFQLSSGKDENSSLNPKFFEEKYNIKAGCMQLADKPEFSEINKEVLKCVRGIRNNYYNFLHFDPGAHFSFINNNVVLTLINNVITNNKDCHYLCFTNEESQKINYWIKEHITNNGEDIATGDLILFNNNIQVEDENDPFSEPKKIYNGQFAVVESVSSEILPETRKLKQGNTTLNFRHLTIKLKETDKPIKILSLENFRNNLKAELSRNETILLKVLLNEEIKLAEKRNPFPASQEFMDIKQENLFRQLDESEKDFVNQIIKKKSRKKDLTPEQNKLNNLISSTRKKYLNRIRVNLRKDPSTRYYKLRNAAHIKFGWSMTVHGSKSFKWQEVIFNVDQGERFSKTNEAYFNWLYTGITRARDKVNLINYKPISPFDKTIVTDNNREIKPPDILFISENPDLAKRLEELREFIDSKLLLSHIIIENVKHINYQERFILSNSALKADISVGYDGHGKFKLPIFINGDKDFGNTAIDLIKQKSKTFDFRVIKDNWRKEQYEQLSKLLINNGINFDFIIQSDYNDKIRLFDNENELDIEVYYTGDGAFSRITAKYYNNIDIWKNFKNVVEKIKV